MGILICSRVTIQDEKDKYTIIVRDHVLWYDGSIALLGQLRIGRLRAIFVGGCLIYLTA